MFNHQNGDTTRANILQYREEIAEFRRIQPRQYLIKQQNARTGREGARHFQALTPRHRQRGGGFVQLRAEAKALAYFFRQCQGIAALGQAQKGTDGDILAHRKPSERLHNLESTRQAKLRQIMRFAPGDLLTIQ